MCHCNDKPNLGQALDVKKAETSWLAAAPFLSAYFMGREFGLLGGVLAFFASKYMIEHRPAGASILSLE